MIDFDKNRGGTFYRPGSYNKICDRTGFKVKVEAAQEEWTGATVRKQSWEPRHPQDQIRAIRDDQSVPDPNPEGEDYYLSTNEVQASDL